MIIKAYIKMNSILAFTYIVKRMKYMYMHVM